MVKCLALLQQREVRCYIIRLHTLNNYTPPPTFVTLSRLCLSPRKIIKILLFSRKSTNIVS